MKIIELTAENIKRLKAVEIHPADHVQVVAGRNAQGKTSVLDAIWLALGGGPAAKGTTRPIRDGEESASVRLDLGDLCITRTWKGERTTLVVQSADGSKYSGPQGVLDALVGRLSFDPLEFTRLSARDQAAALLDLVDLDVDLDEVATRRGKAYAERTEVGRLVKALGEIAEPDAGVPDVETSAQDLIARIRAAQDTVRQQEADVTAVDHWRGQVDELARQLAWARSSLADAEWLVTVQETVPDVAALEAELGALEDTNRAVRQNAHLRTQAAERDRLRDDYATLTNRIELLDQEKATALGAASFPVDGLSFDEAGVTYQGVPFSQASSAEQIRVSLAMAMALNPKLRVIRILDGSLLDAENLALIEDMATEHDYQVWIERVGAGDGGSTVVIEDGAVVSA